jgi:DNA-binding MarR family transcriptional regulator
MLPSSDVRHERMTEQLFDMLLREMRLVHEELHLSRQAQLPLSPPAVDNDFSRLLPVLMSRSVDLKRAPGQAAINATQLRVLSYLLSQARRDRWPEMSSKQLGAATNVHERWARRTVRELQDRGLLVRQDKPGRPTLLDLSPLVEQLEALAAEGAK